jgi:hypothetical protein
MRQSGRAALVWAFGLYAVALVAPVLCLDRWHPTLDNAGSVKLEYLRRQAARAPDRPLVVMLGSSRTDGLFDARRFDAVRGPGGKPVLAYNFGVPTVGPLREYLYLREMLQAGIRPRLLLVELLPPLLTDPHRVAVSEEGWASAPWMSLSEVLTLWPYFAHPGSKLCGWLEARLAPWYAFRACIHGSVLEQFAPQHYPYWGDYRDAWGHILPRVPDAAECACRGGVAYRQYHQTLRTFRPGAGPARAARDLAALCRRERIPLALVLTPESTTFRSWYSPEALAATYGLLAELRDDYGAAVVDAREWVADEDFQDGHHVLPAGAGVFTARLLEDLRPALAAGGAAREANGPVALMPRRRR